MEQTEIIELQLAGWLGNDRHALRINWSICMREKPTIQLRLCSTVSTAQYFILF